MDLFLIICLIYSLRKSEDERPSLEELSEDEFITNFIDAKLDVSFVGAVIDEIKHNENKVIA